MDYTIISPGTFGYEKELARNCAILEKAGFTYQKIPTRKDNEPDWRFSSGSPTSRLDEWNAALRTGVDVIWAARGGYGASDLLPLIDFESLSSLNEKYLVGFSDICALQSALYTRCGWKGLHALMPASTLWIVGEYEEGFTATANFLKGQKNEVSFPVTKEFGTSASIKGKLFGGCFSVLTNLIGTPYMPEDLSGHILFFEDIGENPGKLLRYINQWHQSGRFEGISGIVFGRCVDCFPDEKTARKFYELVFSRVRVPVFSSQFFGHISRQFPLQIGASAMIEDEKLTWYRE